MPSLRLVLVLALLPLAACGEGDEPADSGSSVSSRITGYGANDADWERTHTPDDRFLPGTAYDPDPKLVRGGDPEFSSRYYSVIHEEGRIFVYRMRFPRGTSAGEARRMVIKSEFPDDARASKLRTLDRCGVFTVRSRTLDRAGRTPAAVVLYSGETGDEYDANDVWRAIVTFAPAR